MTSVNAPLVHPDSPAVGLSPRALPPPWSAQLAGQLAGGETVLASLEVDLDDRLPGAVPELRNAVARRPGRMPVCSKEIHAPPSTWTLFRLWRFASPTAGELLAGFLLSLASTAATLVPPYLTMPMMDKVLIPYQNGSRSTPAWSRSISPACSAPRCWPGRSAGRAPTSWRWSPNASAPTCARPPTNTCCAFAGILRRQADRRPDGAHRFGNRPHQHLHFAALARFRHRCADDRDDHGHPGVDQSLAGGWSPCCRCRSSPG
jgi:hypothetical protein